MHSGVSAFRLVAMAAILGLSVAGSATASLPTPDSSEPAPRLGVSGPELRHLGTRQTVPAPKRAVTEISLANGITFDTRTGEPSVAPHLRVNEQVAPDEMISLLVQVQGPVETGWTDQIEAAGARIEFFVPNYAFLVRVRAQDRTALDALPFVDWTGHYHPAYRISGQ
ncbi:MAG: hypothetical protein HKN12_10025, partial [Gemmatimonadetes bacterium]|nr:hypothetical protein [Gemmatimonadota bacterium]